MSVTVPIAYLTGRIVFLFSCITFVLFVFPFLVAVTARFRQAVNHSCADFRSQLNVIKRRDICFDCVRSHLKAKVSQNNPRLTSTIGVHFPSFAARLSGCAGIVARRRGFRRQLLGLGKNQTGRRSDSKPLQSSVYQGTLQFPH